MKLQDQILEVVAHHPQGVLTNAVCKRLGRTPQELGDAFEALTESEEILGFGGLWLTAEAFEAFSQQFLSNLSVFHQSHPATILADPTQIAPWKIPAKPMDRLTTRMAYEKTIYKSKGVRLREFRPVLPDRARQFLDRVKAVLEAEEVNTPNPHQISQLLRVPSVAIEEILKIGVDAGEIVQLDETVFYTEAQLAHLRLTLASLVPHSASAVRDQLGTTRKYAVALLSHFYPRDDESYLPNIGKD